MKIAHTNEFSDETQSIMEHSMETARLAEKFSVPMLKSLMYNLAVLHDIGKYQKSFQTKITGNKSIRVDHSTCGAIEAKKLFGESCYSLIMQYCIAGHHTGLPNGGSIFDSADFTTLHGRLKRETRLEDYSDYKLELKLKKADMASLNSFLNSSGANNKESAIECLSFVTRYCFSCLTDADSLDTAHFCTGREDIELTSDFEECLIKLNERIDSFKCNTALQKARSIVQRQVYNKATESSDVYLADMPTGSGKTLCSMKFALTRAIQTGKRRIIYVIPYNSIIDQTADVFEQLFGSSANILRHQSSFCIDDTDNDENYKVHIKNVTENWNAQIIITTSVQFFESLYSNKRGRLRKLHNIAESVIIFDEAHMMPVEYLQPCLRAVSFITKMFSSEAVFLTATMPDFVSLFNKYALPTSTITELVSDKSLFKCFGKVTFKNIGIVSKEMLIEDAAQKPSALLVVNKRKTAAELYDMSAGKKYHLSTYMSAYDRKRVISEIRSELAALYEDYPSLDNVPCERRILLISTSLIEAGVDLDFHTVYREMTGLDSIIQAGGRCNREGKRENSEVYVFDELTFSHEKRVSITKNLMQSFDDISSEECIREYYKRLYSVNDDVIQKNTIAEDSVSCDSICFESYANKFNLINNSTVAVVVECNDESRILMEELRTNGFTNHRKLQKYTFTVYENELKELIKQGAVIEYNGVWCLVAGDYYSSDKGVSFEAKDYII